MTISLTLLSLDHTLLALVNRQASLAFQINAASEQLVRGEIGEKMGKYHSMLVDSEARQVPMSHAVLPSVLIYHDLRMLIFLE